MLERDINLYRLESQHEQDNIGFLGKILSWLLAQFPFNY